MAQRYVHAYIIMETNNVNHTALYSAVNKTDEFKSESFKRLYWSIPSPYGRKDLSSREHDEVIARAVPVLGFTASFREFVTKKSTRRFVVISKRVDTNEADVMAKASIGLQTFYKQFRRHEGSITVHQINNLANLAMTLELAQACAS